jgi:hypothetical protein
MQCTHFDVYNGKLFEEAVAEETAFLVQQLTGKGAGGGRPVGTDAAAEAEAAADGGHHGEL